MGLCCQYWWIFTAVEEGDVLIIFISFREIYFWRTLHKNGLNGAFYIYRPFLCLEPFLSLCSGLLSVFNEVMRSGDCGRSLLWKVILPWNAIFQVSFIQLPLLLRCYHVSHLKSLTHYLHLRINFLEFWPAWWREATEQLSRQGRRGTVMSFPHRWRRRSGVIVTEKHTETMWVKQAPL